MRFAETSRDREENGVAIFVVFLDESAMRGRGGMNDGSLKRAEEDDDEEEEEGEGERRCWWYRGLFLSAYVSLTLC